MSTVVPDKKAKTISSKIKEKKAAPKMSNSGGQHNTQELNGDLPPKLLKMLNSLPTEASKMV